MFQNNRSDRIPGCSVRPYQILCTLCRLGDSETGWTGVSSLDEILRMAREAPTTPFTLRCRADGVYRYQNPDRNNDGPGGELLNEQRDLTILQRLGLVPGDTRPAGELFERFLVRIHTCRDLCGDPEAGQPAWRGCHRANTGAFEQTVNRGLDSVLPGRDPEERRKVKRETASEFLTAQVLYIRPHHLLCMTCFYGGANPLAPIEEDNLYEAIDAIRRNPSIPVELVRGCCSICPPCPRFDPETQLCVGGHGMSLRDQKKDLDVLRRLDLTYGDRVPAWKLLRRIYDRIPSTMDICGYGDGVETAFEWSICGGADCNRRYARGRAAGLGIPEVQSGISDRPPA